MKTDLIVDEGRRVRDELVKKYGGLEGWIDHLQAMDRARLGKRKQRSATKFSSPPSDLPESLVSKLR